MILTFLRTSISIILLFASQALFGQIPEGGVTMNINLNSPVRSILTLDPPFFK